MRIVVLFILFLVFSVHVAFSQYQTEVIEMIDCPQYDSPNRCLKNNADMSYFNYLTESINDFNNDKKKEGNDSVSLDSFISEILNFKELMMFAENNFLEFFPKTIINENNYLAFSNIRLNAKTNKKEK